MAGDMNCHIICYCPDDGYRLANDTIGPSHCPLCGTRMHYISWNDGEEQAAERMWQQTADDIIKRRGSLAT